MATETKPLFDFKQSTIAGLVELVAGLRDSSRYLSEAAERVDSEYARSLLNQIAEERREICMELASYLPDDDEIEVRNDSLVWTLRMIWTSLRAALSKGDTRVVLIESKRAEDAMLNQFKVILPQIAGNPANDKLLSIFQQVKNGHDKILAMRDFFQNEV